MRKIDKKDEVNGMMTMREDKYFYVVNVGREMDKLTKVMFPTQMIP